MDGGCEIVAVECRSGSTGDAGGEGSKFNPEKEHLNTTTFQEALTPAEKHHEEKVEQKEAESPQEEEDPADIARLNSKRLTQGDGDDGAECIAISEEMLFSIHGLDLTLPVLCDFCPRKFDDFTEFDAHIVTHKECRFFSCQLCSNTYLSWGNLVAHRKACHQGRVLSCDACGQRKFHPSLGPLNFPVGGSPIGCEECGEGFSTITQLYRHYRVHGTHQFMPDKGKLTKVPEQAAEGAVPVSGLCSSQFTSEKQVEDNEFCSASRICNSEYCNAVKHKHMHSALHSCQVCAKVTPNFAGSQEHCTMHSPKSGLEHHKRKYCCQNCNQEFSEWNEITEHVERKHAGLNEMLKCSICGQSWLAGKEFLVHYQSCHMAKKIRDNKRLCPVCHKVFSQQSALNRHLKLHNPLSYRHTCELCGEVIMNRDLVLVHARQHYGAELPESYKKLERLLECEQKYRESMKRKSFICEYCGREFSKKLNLQLHVRRHTGERPYGCQLCGKAFYTNQQLAIHVRRHTGERPYACGICPKTFTGPTALYVHRKLHDKVKRHLCPHCGKRFFWRSAFIGHIRLHTGERPYRCTICSKAFTLKGKLNLHLKKHAILACSDCGENFGSEAELNAHRNEQCCVTMVTFVEDGPSGKRDTHIIVVNTEDLEQNNIYLDDTEVVELVV